MVFATQMVTSKTPANQEDAYRARYPPLQNSRNAAVLLVTQSPQVAQGLSEILFTEGYAVKPVANLKDASDRAKSSYLEVLLLDVNGVVPKSGEYTPDNDAIVFLKNIQRNNPSLRVLLINSGRLTDQALPVINDLMNLDAVGKQNGSGRQPFDVSDISKGPSQEGPSTYSAFFEKLRSTVEDVVRTQEAALQVVGRGINFTRPVYDPLPLTVGEAVRAAYERNRQGGAGHFLIDSINGIAVSVKPRQHYTEKDSTFHIKPVTLEEAIRTNETFQYLTGKNRNRRIPVPFGSYTVEDSGRAYLLLSFLIAANNSDMRRALDPSNPEVQEADRDIAAGIWKANLDDLFRTEYPQWHRDTHERVMEADHKAARDSTVQKQIEQMSLFLRHSADISGRPLPTGLQQNLQGAVLTLYKELGPIDERLFVLPMDPKAANIGRVTYQSVPSTQRLLELFTIDQAGNRQVNKEALGSGTFAHWDHKMLGTVDTIFADLWQALLDPAHRIPEEERPARLYEATTAIFPESDFNTFLVESLRQGLYKSALKTFVQVAHAQVNEGRLARMKTLDYDSAVATRKSLQAEVEYFAKHVLMFSAALHATLAEGYANMPGNIGIEKLKEHFSDENRWQIPRSTGSQSAALEALTTIHSGFSLILKEGLHQFDPKLLKRNYEQSKTLKY